MLNFTMNQVGVSGINCSFYFTDSNKNKNKTKSTPKPSQQKPEPEPKLTLSHAKEEIVRLEALCESRTKELNLAKIDMKSCLSGFDAMAALVNYLSHDVSYSSDIWWARVLIMPTPGFAMIS